jgi:hypothetical protein
VVTPKFTSGKGMVNFVMHSKFAIPKLGEIEVVMNVMEHAIKEKTQS